MKELIYSRQLLPAAEQFPDKLAFIDDGTAHSFGIHVERTSRLANALGSELGLAVSDRFAVMALNSRSYLELYHAAFLGGGVINPLNLRLAPAELAYILADSGTRVCVVDAIFAPLVDAIRAQTSVDTVVLIGSGDAPHDVRYEDLVAAGESGLPTEPEEDSPVVLMYTGGTTGLPKGVLLDQRAEMLNLYHGRALWQIDSREVFLNQTPMFHAASMGGILAVPAAGGTSTFVPMFEPGAVLDAVEAHDVTMTVMVPTMIGLTVNHPAYSPTRLSSLQKLAYGASPMPQTLLERLLAELPACEIFQAYGMTEASAVVTYLGPEEHRAGGALLRSAGRAVPGVVLSIQNEDGNELPRGQTGEVCVKAGNLMIEYWNQPEATAEAFRGGWYHTGDAGYLDENGYLFLVDRVKDMIVTGGENVYSVEVENALASHDAVLQAAVIGIPHEQWGESVHAIVVLHEGASVTIEELLAHSRDLIAGYKLPKSVEFRTEALPLSGAMKVLKRELRAPYWESHGRGVG